MTHTIRFSRMVMAVWVVAVALLVSGAVVLAVPAAAFGYHADGREGTYACVDCHGDERDDWTGEGPHGYYTGSTSKCKMCHTVHDAAAGGVLLLPTPTVSQSCFTCHDGTGAVGVYSQIVSRGGTVQAEHAIDTTSAVPGGSLPLDGLLGCTSCHTPHRATALAPYLKDTGRAMASKEYVYSNSLLRDDVNGLPNGTITNYGGAWCAACHDGRTSVGMSNNHPTTETVAYDLGRSNVGYAMAPVGTAPRQEPYCQQCHEDARDVEAAFSASLKDYGYPPPDAPTNPAYTAFPHQTANLNMTLEQYDDLCLNCHGGESLP
ncbi:MAG: hypothetical protein LLG24_07835 [Actinomycetia bacterium]|nr:hypothetical protein [Actinomycetes bacterium]